MSNSSFLVVLLFTFIPFPVAWFFLGLDAAVLCPVVLGVISTWIAIFLDVKKSHAVIKEGNE